MKPQKITILLTQEHSSSLNKIRNDEASTAQPVLARAIQRDVLSGEPIHVDFLAVSMTEKITADVTVNLVGEPVSVTEGEGVLLQGANTLQIECLPSDLIRSLVVDVSELEFNSALYVADLEIPANITILADPEDLVAQVVPERLEEEEEELEEEVLFEEEPADVEVITAARDKEDEE
jgi:large subunit ribosomal protein L25